MKINSNAIRTSMCVLAIGLSAGSFYTVMAHQPETAEAQSAAAVPVGQVDLTYAAEKALPAVVHIRFVQNSKVTTVDVQNDPFGDFFDPFGFFGNPGGGNRQRQVQTPKREGAGSGVIISSDG